MNGTSPRHRLYLRTASLLAAAVCGAFLAAFVALHVVAAFTGPTANPPSGSGAISVSGSNVGIGTGTSTPVSPLTVGLASYGDGTLEVVNTIGIDGAPNLNPGTNRWTLRVGNIGPGEGKFDIYDARNSLSRFLIDGSGNVGIGTSTPAAKLEVNGNIISDGTISGSYTGVTSAGNISAGTFGSNTGGGNYTFPAAAVLNSMGTAQIDLNSAGTYWGNISNPSSQVWALGYGSGGTTIGTPVLVWNASGNVGIGTTTPATRFVVDTGNSGYVSIGPSNYILQASGNWNGTQPTTLTPGGMLTLTPGTASYPGGNAILSGGATSPYYGSNPGASITAQGAGYSSGGNIVMQLGSDVNGGSPTFHLNAGTGASLMTITNSGDVGIGTTTPAYPLDVNGAASFEGNVIHGVGTPVAATDAANKSYVDAAVSGGGGPWTLSGSNVYVTNMGYRVGIGTTTPQKNLEIDSTIEPDLRLNNTAYTDWDIFSGGGGSATFNNMLTFYNRTGGQWVGVQNNGNFIVNSGNVGIGTTSPGANLEVTGAMLDSNGGNVLHYRNVLGYYIGGGTLSGTLEIIMPNGWTNTMMQATIRGYDYSGNGAWEVRVGGYNYASGSAWYNTTAQISGRAPFSSVRLAYDSALGKNVILLGTTGTAWSYGAVEVSDFIASYSNQRTNWGSGWSAALLSSESNITSVNTPATDMIDVAGNIGIGTASPGYKLDVNGAGNFNSYVIHNVGTPILSTDAANKSYVDTAVAGGSGIGSFSSLTVSGGSTLTGAVSMGAGLNFTGGSAANITGLNKITVGTVDPVYDIGGVKYATYGPSMANGVTEEVEATGTLAKEGSDYQYAIDFAKLPQGSPLWVWYQAVDFGRDSVEALATPYGQFAEIYYTIDGTTLTFHGTAPAEFSFRLTGKRFDWQQWPTRASDQSEQAGFVLTPKG